MVHLPLRVLVSPLMHTLPIAWRATAERATRRLRQGWNAIRRRQGPGARHPHFDMKQPGRGAAFLSVSARLVVASGKTVRVRLFCGCGPDQRIASSDAGIAKIARDFLMDIHGMEKCCCAVKKGDQREGRRSVLVRLATKLLGKIPLQKFE